MFRGLNALGAGPGDTKGCEPACGARNSATLGGLASVTYPPRAAWGAAVYAVMATDPCPKGLPSLQRDLKKF